jgi:hypothetical protein
VTKRRQRVPVGVFMQQIATECGGLAWLAGYPYEDNPWKMTKNRDAPAETHRPAHPAAAIWALGFLLVFGWAFHCAGVR